MLEEKTLSVRGTARRLGYTTQYVYFLLWNGRFLAVRGGSTFSELRWYPPVEAAKGSLSWVFRAKQPESVRTGP